MRELELQLRAYGSVLDRSDADRDRCRRRAAPAYAAVVCRRLAAAIVVALVASAIVVRTTRSSDGRPPRIVTPSPTTVPKVLPPSRVLMIGDSVMEGAKGALESAIPGAVVDAVMSRQFSQGEQVLKEYRDLDALPDTLVIALGTNGAVTAGALDAIMRAAGPQRQVYFVEVRVPRPWESEVNAALDATPGRWPNAHVIGWHDYANVHDEWFVLDGFHLTTVGQYAYAYPGPGVHWPDAAADNHHDGADDERARRRERHRGADAAARTARRRRRQGVDRHRVENRHGGGASRRTRPDDDESRRHDRRAPRSGVLDRGRRRHVVGRRWRRRWRAPDNRVEGRCADGHGRLHEDAHRHTLFVPDRGREPRASGWSATAPRMRFTSRRSMVT